MTETVAANLRRLMAYHEQQNPTAAARALGISQQQLDRILKGQRLRVDTLERVARAYGLEPYQMLVPELNPANPQILRTATPAEERLYAALEALRRENSHSRER